MINDGNNISYIYSNLISKYNANIYKHLNKNINYIIFKDGHLKTKKYANLNNINIVNPFWKYDKVDNNIFKKDEEYIIDNNYNDIVFKEEIQQIEKRNKKNINKESNNFEVELEVEYDAE